MSLVERPGDHVDCIPDDHVVDGQEHRQKQSYRSSLSTSPRPPTPPSHTDTDPDGANMDQFNDDMLSTQPNNSKQAPALPPRSALRASRLLATLPQKLPTEDRPVLTPAAPHILYLSSEEDASSSADDFSDCDYSSDSEQSLQTPQDQTSHEDTARMVSVVFSGKPSIIELPRRSISRSSSADSAVGGLVRTSTEPTLVYRKDSASSNSLAALQQHPPRSSSMISTSFDMQRPQFLHVDPFAAAKTETEEPEAQQARKPTMFKRTLSLVRKRSKPLLNPGSAHSRENLSIQTAPMEQVGEEKEENHVSESRSASARLPSTYQDLMTSARRTSYSAASSPVSPATSPSSPTKRIRHGFMARRRSIRA